MLKGPKLAPAQWKVLSSTFSNIGQAIILFSLAAIFVPQAINLPGEFSVLISLGFLGCGSVTIGIGVIMAKKEK